MLHSYNCCSLFLFLFNLLKDSSFGLFLSFCFRMLRVCRPFNCTSKVDTLVASSEFNGLVLFLMQHFLRRWYSNPVGCLNFLAQMGHCVATTGGEGDFEVEREVFIGDGGLGEDAFEVVRELRRRDKFMVV